MKGILFKPENIKAILEGRKTMTRRVIKSIKPEYIKLKPYSYSFAPRIEYMEKDIIQVQPKYKLNEIIYVKETWFNEMMDEKYLTLYKSDNINIGGYKWKSSILMPEWASRIKLQITNIRVEKIQDITIKDILAEGTESKLSFMVLWDSINKPPYSWADNPFCFVYCLGSFKPKPEGKERL